MKTYTLKAKDIDRQWHLVDVKNQTLGRIATDIAQKLIGKHKLNYTPHMDNGDYVVVVNAEQIQVTGRKLTDKRYYHHTGYPGALKSATLQEKMDKDIVKVIETTVKGMLPKNKLRDPRLRRLKVFAGDEHPYADQLAKSTNK